MASHKTQISLWHVLWIAPLCLLLATCIGGCATDSEQAMAYSEPGFVVKPITYYVVNDPQLICVGTGIVPDPWPRNTLACADIRGKINTRRCTIVLPPLVLEASLISYLVEHEELHCLRGAFHP